MDTINNSFKMLLVHFEQILGTFIYYVEEITLQNYFVNFIIKLQEKNRNIL